MTDRQRPGAWNLARTRRTVDRIAEGEPDEALIRNQFDAEARARFEAEAAERIRRDPRWRPEVPRGGRKPGSRSKLTADQARAIKRRRPEYLAQPPGGKARMLRAVAAEYGVSPRTIDGILRGDTWATILEDQEA